eukprot:scaffold266341_cov52-Attheya_sp.AAC.1
MKRAKRNETKEQERERERRETSNKPDKRPGKKRKNEHINNPPRLNERGLNEWKSTTPLDTSGYTECVLRFDTDPVDLTMSNGGHAAHHVRSHRDRELIEVVRCSIMRDSQ